MENEREKLVEVRGRGKKTAGIILLVIGITLFILSCIIIGVANTRIIEEALSPILIGVFMAIVAFPVVIAGAILFDKGFSEERRRRKHR